MTAKPRILLVDDRAENLTALEAILSSLNQVLVPVRSGDEALKALLTGEFAVILLDVVMPRRNGFQACRDLKSQGRYSNIPVILVTSKTTPSDRFWGEQQGANGYVAKPFTPDELLSAVKRFA